MKPRTEWACPPGAFISSFSVTPPARVSRPQNLGVLVPGRAGDTFLAPVALRAGLALIGAGGGRGLAPLAFVVAVAGAVLVCSRGVSHLEGSP